MEIDKFIICRTYTTLHSTYIAYDFLEDCLELSFDFTLTFVLCFLNCYFCLGFTFNNNSSRVFLDRGLILVVILCEDCLNLLCVSTFHPICFKLHKRVNRFLKQIIRSSILPKFSTLMKLYYLVSEFSKFVLHLYYLFSFLVISAIQAAAQISASIALVILHKYSAKIIVHSALNVLSNSSLSIIKR